MGMQSMTLLAGATVSATGGTTQTLTPTNESVVGGIKLIDASVADMRIRPYVIAKCSWPTINPSTGKYTGKVKHTLQYVEPVLETDGTISFQTIKIERSVTPSYAAASAVDLNKKGAQLLVDSDTTSFLATGSLA